MRKKTFLLLLLLATNFFPVHAGVDTLRVTVDTLAAVPAQDDTTKDITDAGTTAIVDSLTASPAEIDSSRAVYTAGIKFVPVFSEYNWVANINCDGQYRTRCVFGSEAIPIVNSPHNLLAAHFRQVRQNIEHPLHHDLIEIERVPVRPFHQQQRPDQLVLITLVLALVAGSLLLLLRKKMLAQRGIE